MENGGRTPVGQVALRTLLGLRVPAPAVESYVGAGSRRTEIHPGGRTLEHYTRNYEVDGSIPGHLRFALRYEPLDLRLLAATFRRVDPEVLASWVRSEPTGSYSRRAWFLYEFLTGSRLDLEDARAGNYVEALDPKRHLVGGRRNSPRHRVIDNLLGGPGFCVTVRRTPRLAEQMAQRIDEEARRLVDAVDPALLARAVNYLFTKETRSSFAIEGEAPGPRRADRFVAALRTAPEFDPTDKVAIVALQARIVEARYAASDWRTVQNFVGETIGGYREKIHYICPRPEDVPDLMASWAAMTRRLLEDDTVDPVVAAAAIAFGFVFIHPFEDGNGRLHRFLIHSVLARKGFGPRGVLLPVSASIVRDRRLYDEALESFSAPLFECIDHHLDADQQLEVEGETAELYRYFDATALAEYLYDRVADAVRKDLREELGFVAVFDRALAGVLDVVDMPDRRASLLVRLCLQNGGRLSRRKRGDFSELTDAEIERMEAAVQRAVRDAPPDLPAPEPQAD